MTVSLIRLCCRGQHVTGVGSIAALLASLAVALSTAYARADSGESFELVGDLAGKKPDKDAKDVSGIACMDPPGSPVHRCLVINDENKSAQFITVTVRDRKIEVGAQLPLIGARPNDATLGAKPTVACPNEGEFDELDGEGIAFSQPYFYVAGSHGCSRKHGEFRLSSFILARIRVDKNGRVVDRNGQAPAPAADPLQLVETTYRLTDVLRQVDEVGGFGKKLRSTDGLNFFGKDLNTANGLNVEGIAVVGDRLLAGLRAPASPDGKAYIVSAPIAALFAPGNTIEKIDSEVIELPLEKDRGVRDMTMLPDGKLLILAGPAQEQDIAYSFFTSEPRPGGEFKKVATIEKFEGENRFRKAEAVAVLDASGDSLSVLVLFDSVKNGSPMKYRIQTKN